MDISETIQPDSDQLDAIDLLTGPRTFTIESVSKGNAEQPVQIHLAEFPRPWRPGKSMRRVLVAAWGTDAATYTGRRVTLYCDPDVTFGKDKVGGTRISHLSHIDGPLSVPLLVSRGRSATFTVQPLTDAPSGGITEGQRKNLHRLVTELGLTREEKLAGASHYAGRMIDSTNELTEDEARKVIAALEAKVAESKGDA